jgi:hypothetical protein
MRVCNPSNRQSPWGENIVPNAYRRDLEESFHAQDCASRQPLLIWICSSVAYGVGFVLICRPPGLPNVLMLAQFRREWSEAGSFKFR